MNYLAIVKLNKSRMSYTVKETNLSCLRAAAKAAAELDQETGSHGECFPGSNWIVAGLWEVNAFETEAEAHKWLEERKAMYSRNY